MACPAEARQSESWLPEQDAVRTFVDEIFMFEKIQDIIGNCPIQ